jgi:hypothetical protein
MSREAMQMALEALDSDNSDIQLRAAIVLRQALKQEPFEYWSVADGWVKIDEVREHFDSVGCGTIYKSAGEGRSPLYTAPPKREWQGLTDEEIDDLSYLSQKIDASNAAWFDRWGFARAIEQALKEKNKW